MLITYVENIPPQNFQSNLSLKLSTKIFFETNIEKLFKFHPKSQSQILSIIISRNKRVV